MRRSFLFLLVVVGLVVLVGIVARSCKDGPALPTVTLPANTFTLSPSYTPTSTAMPPTDTATPRPTATIAPSATQVAPTATYTPQTVTPTPTSTQTPVMDAPVKKDRERDAPMPRFCIKEPYNKHCILNYWHELKRLGLLP